MVKVQEADGKIIHMQNHLDKIPIRPPRICTLGEHGFVLVGAAVSRPVRPVIPTLGLTITKNLLEIIGEFYVGIGA